MRTPIFDFLKKYRESDTVRLHMPGHKGHGELGVEGYDITEICGADTLFSPDGIIAESEGYATELFGTQKTFYSTEGSTLAIKAMLAIVSQGKKQAKILATRASHKAFMYAAALLDLDVDFLYSRNAKNICEGEVGASDVEEALLLGRYDAVYITSPDYLGNISDIKDISEVCHKHGIPLLVDNAHGAYLRFLEPSRHPIDLGADMCCDSAHKTLSALTGTAYLHISKNAPTEYADAARDMLALFGSTSPSYLLLASLDICNKKLSEGYREDLAKVVEEVASLKANLTRNGIKVQNTEPLKIVISANELGYTGVDFSEYLRKFGIECEFSDAEYTVMMLTPENTPEELRRTQDIILSLPRRATIINFSHTLSEIPHRYKMKIREALFAKSETVSVLNAVGRICAAPTVSCPPAIPIAISGEVIVPEMLPYFKKYGIKEIKVVK